MKYFVAYKKVKLPKYKFYYIVFGLLVLLIFTFNVLMTIFLNKNNSEDFINVFLDNSFGMTTKYFNNENKYFYKNVFGIPFLNETTVIKENGTVENIVASDLEKIVYIYNTFQTDQYKSNYFNSYSMASYVTQGSFILQEYLKNLNVGSVVEEESVVKVLKDNNINYTNSYAGSKILLEKKVLEYPSLKYYFDLQLSDYEREATTVTIDGVSFAKILFVVGTDNKNYQKNQNFAIKLNEILEKNNSELSRGVSLRGGSGYQGVYNQDFSEYALLIQVGGIYNTIDEVNRSLKILAQVITNYIMGDSYEEK